MGDTWRIPGIEGVAQQQVVDGTHFVSISILDFSFFCFIDINWLFYDLLSDFNVKKYVDFHLIKSMPHAEEPLCSRKYLLTVEPFRAKRELTRKLLYSGGKLAVRPSLDIEFYYGHC